MDLPLIATSPSKRLHPSQRIQPPVDDDSSQETNRGEQIPSSGSDDSQSSSPPPPPQPRPPNPPQLLQLTNDRQNERPTGGPVHKRDTPTRKELAESIFYGETAIDLQFHHPRINDFLHHLEDRQTDPQWCHTLQRDIANHWYASETFTAPRFDLQTDIQPCHRHVLIQWMVQIQSCLGLRDESLHLSVSILDRVLSLVQFPRSSLQLLACTAIFMATKIEEVSAPRLPFYIALSNNSLAPHELITMERTVFAMLGFKLTTPYAIDFANFYINSLFLESSTILYIYYILDRLLLEHDILANFTPSQQAISAIIFALHTFHLFDILDAFILQQTTAYPHTTSSIVQCIYFIWQSMSMYQAPPNEVHAKYCSESYCEVALLEYPNLRHPDNIRYMHYRQTEPTPVLAQTPPVFKRRSSEDFTALVHTHRDYETNYYGQQGLDIEAAVISINTLAFHLCRPPPNRPEPPPPVPTTLPVPDESSTPTTTNPPPQPQPPAVPPQQQNGLPPFLIAARRAHAIILYYTPPTHTPVFRAPLLYDFEVDMGTATPGSYEYAKAIRARYKVLAIHDANPHLTLNQVEHILTMEEMKGAQRNTQNNQINHNNPQTAHTLQLRPQQPHITRTQAPTYSRYQHNAVLRENELVQLGQAVVDPHQQVQQIDDAVAQMGIIMGMGQDAIQSARNAENRHPHHAQHQRASLSRPHPRPNLHHDDQDHHAHAQAQQLLRNNNAYRQPPVVSHHHNNHQNPHHTLSHAHPHNSFQQSNIQQQPQHHHPHHQQQYGQGPVHSQNRNPNAAPTAQPRNRLNSTQQNLFHRSLGMVSQRQSHRATNAANAGEDILPHKQNPHSH